jgi:PAS domain S-box-containing protein
MPVESPASQGPAKRRDGPEPLNREQRYRAIFEHPTELSVVLEAVCDAGGEVIDWRYLDANSNSVRLLERPYDQLIGSLMSEVIPKRFPSVFALCAQVLRERAPLRYEHEIEGRNYQMCLFPVGTDVIVSTGSDITDRAAATREVERQLEADRAEKEWLAAVLDSMTEEVYFADPSGRYTYANPAARREFGLDDVSGRRVADVIAGLEVLREDGTPRPIEQAPPLRALKGEIIRDEEQRVRTPRTGELRHRQVSSAPVRNANGDIIGSVSVVHDITERKRTEEALRRREQELREADRHKDQFIAVLAHELRNPLVPIRNGIELLKNAASRPDLLESVRPMMERQIAHMVRLIDDLLDVARISADKIELRREHVAVSAVLTSAVEATRAALEGANLELTVDVAEPDAVLHADPTRLSQVIANVLQNAAKFTPPGGRVRVTSHRDAHDASQVVIRIADTGIGIAPDQLPRVFNLFAQSATHLRGHQGGLGIGLAIARRLVEMHGGNIVAHSEGENRGSEFVITLPVVDARADMDGAHALAQSALAGLRVLIVDDNHDAADSMALLVQLEGAETRVVYAAEPALELIESFDPQVVLLDIGMPVVDGYEACRRIRARHGRRHALIAVSGWGQDGDKKLAEAAGFDSHLTKPAEPEALHQLVRALAERRR